MGPSIPCLIKNRKDKFPIYGYWFSIKQKGNTKNCTILGDGKLSNEQHFSSTKLVSQRSIHPVHAYDFNFTLSLSLSISLQIIVSNHRYVQDTFCDIPQSFLRPKDSQITAVTRSNFAQQRHSEYKHVRVVCGSFRGFKSGMETNFRIRTIASHRGNEIFVSCIRQKMHNQSDNALCT